MQLLLIRHALPEHLVVNGGYADPSLTVEGHEQAARLQAALSPYPIHRIFASPQRRAQQTVAPIAADRGIDVEILDGLAEYDYGQNYYVPIHEAATSRPDIYAAILAGELPDFVDVNAFKDRVLCTIDHIVDICDHSDTCVVAAHGGVINALLAHEIGSGRPLPFRLDYVSISRVLISRSGHRRIASINETGHVRDILDV